MSEHHISVTVQAPIHQVYTFFTHFNDFPKFMSFVKEVTYLDEQRSHWVVQVMGKHEWDAVNENWLPDQRVGWRSTNGLTNKGQVNFIAITPTSTQVDVYLSYTPAAGIIGEAVELLGGDSHFDAVLHKDMQRFAQLVEAAPAGALDPMQSHYLFHPDSAVASGTATERQQATMSADPMMSQQALQERNTHIEREEALTQQSRQARATSHENQQAQLQQSAQQQDVVLKQQAKRDAQIAQEQARQTDLPLVHETLGGRAPSMERTAIGDQDSRSERFPKANQDPMTSRAPGHNQTQEGQPLSEVEEESPWHTMIHGQGQSQASLQNRQNQESAAQTKEDRG